MLNSVGLANPGLDAVARHELPWLGDHLQRARILVNVVGFEPDDYRRVVDRLSSFDVITAFELNVSCPNTKRGGEEFGANADVLANLVTVCKASTDKPVIVKLAPTLPDVAATAETAVGAGADGVTAVNTIPGLLFESDGGVPRHPRLGAGSGGVSGPALLPVGTLAVRRVRERVTCPIIGVGGVRIVDDLLQYQAAGADLVAIGTAGMADPRRPVRVARQWMARVGRSESSFGVYTGTA
jgi:dihydroorotate dehydrogenase (NAD+) catalytic subunit